MTGLLQRATKVADSQVLFEFGTNQRYSHRPAPLDSCASSGRSTENSTSASASPASSTGDDDAPFPRVGGSTAFRSSLGAAMVRPMASFVLLHGAWGVPREWDAVIATLGASGHEAIAVDLPITDPGSCLEHYADCIVSAAARMRGPLIVVGHSAGGHAAALVPARRAVSRIVYLSAFVPIPRTGFLVRRDGEPLMAAHGGDFELSSAAFRSVIVDRNDGTCELDALRLASFMAGEAAADFLVPMLRPLLRPNGLRVFEEPWPRDELPRVPSTYLLTGADPVLPPASQRIFARRLGVEPEEIAGADHGVHMKKPRVVAALLDREAQLAVSGVA